MVKTCCIYSSRTNYRTERRDRDEKKKEHIPVYRFPNKKNNEERQRRIAVVKKINANLEVGDETVICSRHWPENCAMKRHYRKERPVDPPSVYDTYMLFNFENTGMLLVFMYYRINCIINFVT